MSVLAAVCPRCGGGFDCGVGGPAPCACGSLQLSAALLQRLRTQYPTHCLCLPCLSALADLERAESQPADSARPASPGPLA